MKKSYTITNDEPVGIVISHGSQVAPSDEPTPVFRAYAWGPAPEPATGDTSKAA